MASSKEKKIRAFIRACGRLAAIRALRTLGNDNRLINEKIRLPWKKHEDAMVFADYVASVGSLPTELGKRRKTYKRGIQSVCQELFLKTQNLCFVRYYVEFWEAVNSLKIKEKKS